MGIPSKIKICYILSHLPQGGAERQTINLIKALDYSRYEITLIMYANAEIFYKEIFELPIHLFVHRSPKVWKLFRNINNVIYLRKILIRNDFDILHTLLFHNGFWVRLVAPQRYSQRIIYSIRNDLQDGPKFYLFFEKFLIRRSYAITNSLKARDQFRALVGEKYHHKILNIYNGFEINRFNLDAPPQVEEKIIIGTVGRQTAQKNQIQVLEAINRISEKYSLHFYLIGDKAKDGYKINETYVITNGLENCVTILDSQSEIESYYKRFNIFVLASFYEGCPNVLFEAMLARCLCIVSRGANSDHFIQDGINGLVYDGSTSMLVTKLEAAIDLLRNRDSAVIVDNGNRYAQDNFTLSRMVNSYENTYEKLLVNEDK
jgi:GalNAc-alpha-(1->4)-GalNAc-alpha-(1->3)-diNAcBac-PP-undecaprenol alpha-1,4-N-acetyl-D-galactosaminyltransferase